MRPRDQLYDALAFGELRSRLRTIDPRKATVLELIVYEGFTVRQTANVLGISESTVKTCWKMTKQWLRGHMEAARPPARRK